MSLLERFGPQAVKYARRIAQVRPQGDSLICGDCFGMPERCRDCPAHAEGAEHSPLKVVMAASPAVFVLGDEGEIAVAGDALWTAWVSTCADVVDEMRRDPVTNRFYPPLLL